MLSKTSQLQNLKNSAIVGITLATRASIDGGLNHNIAFTLSDLFIQKLEELNEHIAVTQLIEKALLDFTERVQITKNMKNSKPINMCLNYVYAHLYEHITLSGLAKLVNMNPNYLSNLFKKEVGITLTRFIQQAKVEEAKNLITFTSHSLTEISTLLNFHDQSYFTKIFKKFTGVTPKQYKNGPIN